MENYQPFHSGLKRLAKNTAEEQRAELEAIGVADLQSAISPIIAILLSNADTITADEVTETLVVSDDTSTDILGPGL